jgi:hypothetical protein
MELEALPERATGSCQELLELVGAALDIAHEDRLHAPRVTPPG